MLIACMLLSKAALGFPENKKKWLTKNIERVELRQNRLDTYHRLQLPKKSYLREMKVNFVLLVNWMRQSIWFQNYHHRQEQ